MAESSATRNEQKTNSREQNRVEEQSSGAQQRAGQRAASSEQSSDRLKEFKPHRTVRVQAAAAAKVPPTRAGCSGHEKDALFHGNDNTWLPHPCREQPRSMDNGLRKAHVHVETLAASNTTVREHGGTKCTNIVNDILLCISFRYVQKMNGRFVLQSSTNWIRTTQRAWKNDAGKLNVIYTENFFKKHRGRKRHQ